MKKLALAIATLFISCLAPAWAQQHLHATPPAAPAPPEIAQAQVPVPPLPQPTGSGTRGGDMHTPTIFTLRTGIAEGRMVFLGVGGNINGLVNPTLNVHEGETVQINLINGEGAEHDIVVEQYAVRSDRVVGKAASSTMSFTADRTGEFIYYCSVPGHREAGMQGRIQVAPGPGTAAAATAPDIVRDPTDLPGPLHARASQVVRVDLDTVERVGQLDDKNSIQLLDLQRQGARPIPARARRRYRRGAPQKPQRQCDGAFGGFSCSDRSGRRCDVHPD